MTIQPKTCGTERTFLVSRLFLALFSFTTLLVSWGPTRAAEPEQTLRVPEEVLELISKPHVARALVRAADRGRVVENITFQPGARGGAQFRIVFDDGHGLLVRDPRLASGSDSSGTQPDADSSGREVADGFGAPHIGQVALPVPIIPHVKIYDFERIVHDGPFDVTPSLDRIRSGQRLPSGNDGVFHKNREQRLPVCPDPQYYREFRIRRDGLPFPGAQRLIIGKGGEVYFTGDHYKTFTRVNP